MTLPDAARDQPLIAIDVVPVAYATGSGLRVATARRVSEPALGLEALPGVLLDGPELLQDAAYRALRTKAGFPAAAVRHLVQIGAFDGPDRDPRSAAISVSFVAVVDPPADAADAAPVGAMPAGAAPAGAAPAGAAPAGAAPAGAAPDVAVTWHPLVSPVPLGLPFDHDRIIDAARDALRVRLWSDLPMTRALLGERFPTSAASGLAAALLGTAPDAGNLNRALRTNPRLTAEPDRGASTGGRGGRPPTVWTWADVA